MTVRLVSVSIDASDVGRLAAFWASALAWDARPLARGDIELVPTDVTSFSLRFRHRPVPKRGQNRIHFDLTTTSIADRDATVEGLIVGGGRLADVGQGPDESHIVLADPEDNEFCVIDPSSRFLASCPRLGAVNCDGTSDSTSTSRRLQGGASLQHRLT